MARKLRSVKLDEISFVGKGDNPEAHVMLLKMRPNGDGSISKSDKKVVDLAILKRWFDDNGTLLIKDDGEAITFDQIQNDRELREEVWDMCWTLEDSIGSILRDDTVTDKTAMITTSIDQFKAAITAITKGEDHMSVELKKQLEAEQEKNVALTKENETLKACAAEDKKKADALAAENAKLKKDSESDEDPIYKGLPEAVVKKMKDDSARITKMEDENLTREYVGKAVEIGRIGKADEVGTLLKKIASFDSATADAVFTLLKTADTRIAAGGLLKEKGDNTNTGVASAYDQMVTKATELRKTCPELTDAQAFVKVFDTEHDLRAAYELERKSN